MTGTKVVDASALAALLFGEPEAEAIAERLDGAHLVAPSLMAFELATVCLVKCRRHSDSAKRFWRASVARTAWRIAVDHDAVVELALATGLTAYDTSYLWLARQFGANLITLDKALDKAATTG